MPDRKINFCSRFDVDTLFRSLFTTLANDNIVSPKSLHTIFDTYLAYMQVNFEQNRMVRNTQNFDFFLNIAIPSYRPIGIVTLSIHDTLLSVQGNCTN